MSHGVGGQFAGDQDGVVGGGAAVEEGGQDRSRIAANRGGPLLPALHNYCVAHGFCRAVFERATKGI